MLKRLFRVALTAALSISMAFPAYAGEKQPKKVVEIPHCVRSLGTAAVRVRPETTDWWTGQNLGSPETVVKAIVRESGCFTLVDRGAGMQMADEERARAASGNLRKGSNIGRGQVLAADYIIVPDLMTQNGHSGGFHVGALLGFVPVIGGAASAIAGGASISKKTADVHLEIISVRSGEVVASANGSAKKSDLSLGGGGGGFGSGSFGAFGASGYTDTEIGKVIMSAYVDAYIKLVTQAGGVTQSLPAVASLASPRAEEPVAPQSSVTTIRAATLRAAAAPTAKVVRALPAGTVLYPTGEKTGTWLKVDDEVGAEGWVSSLSVSGH